MLLPSVESEQSLLLRCDAKRMVTINNCGRDVCMWRDKEKREIFNDIIRAREIKNQVP